MLTAGGGSGGHVTPVVAVLKQLREHAPDAEVRFWCDYAFYKQAKATMHAFDPSIRVSRTVSGKLRRYHHLTPLQHLRMPSTILLNIRDIFLTGIGALQSIVRLILWRPDVVFTKGGFVCLPIGFAAHLLRIPLVIHDSDAHPGLTNRILSRWATKIATGAPLKYYPYPAEKTQHVGIPVADEFRHYSVQEKMQFRQEINAAVDRPLVVITGGGLGATRINDATLAQLPVLREHASVILISGTGQYEELRRRVPENDASFQLLPFVSGNMFAYLAAADIVVTRAGATTLLELAGLSVATILVPNGKLTGGHQLKNAQVYVEQDAVVSVEDEMLEQHPEILSRAIIDLLNNPKRRDELAHNIGALATPHAAESVATFVLQTAGLSDSKQKVS